MRKPMLAKAVLILILSDGHAMAQGSGSSRTVPHSSQPSSRPNQAVPATPQPPTPAQFAASFWNYLNDAKASYRQWGSPGKTRRPEWKQELGRPGEVGEQPDMPHREIGQTYLNNVANTNLQRLPLKSVLVRESYAADGQTLENITVMYRSKGFDPKNGDWYWIKYLPDGSLATTSLEKGNRPIAGRVDSCIQCHQKAGGNDSMFLNDQPAPGAPQDNPHGKAPGVPQTNPDGSGARR